jgi:hypothetical protein
MSVAILIKPVTPRYQLFPDQVLAGSSHAPSHPAAPLFASLPPAHTPGNTGLDETPRGRRAQAGRLDAIEGQMLPETRSLSEEAGPTGDALPSIGGLGARGCGDGLAAKRILIFALLGAPGLARPLDTHPGPAALALLVDVPVAVAVAVAVAVEGRYAPRNALKAREVAGWWSGRETRLQRARG